MKGLLLCWDRGRGREVGPQKPHGVYSGVLGLTLAHLPNRREGCSVSVAQVLNFSPGKQLQSRPKFGGGGDV
jgi:hypothetical protein